MTQNTSQQTFVPPPYEGHSPLSWYQLASERPQFIQDDAQQNAIRILDELWQNLVYFKTKRKRILGKNFFQPALPKGLFLWGGVGRGKSFLMDTFFATLPYKRKRRVHFHAFMAEVHERLKTLKHQENPLDIVAKNIAKETRVLCFDEFHVSDIADAMILGRLLDGLFKYGVVLIATSNYAPKDLYPGGLKRDQFIPTIKLLEEKLDVIQMDGGQDHRHRTLVNAGVFFIPNDANSHEKMHQLFESITQGQIPRPGQMVILDRPVHFLGEAGQTIWFDFKDLCLGPRSQADYLYLAERYDTVFLSNIVQLTATERNEARRFTWLVDVFYDYRVKLIASSAVNVDEVYIQGDFSQEFFRTASRLTEMQSEQYLDLPHLKLKPD
ncbi:cell division protein ZapE [Neisseria sp. Ec49-e6-T10]|uniref:cell division protein ZapE n=1 Tax=Neisseria sp. Ec49-e6-T10 TaxID=3140744 RepID=UPI003EBD11EF